MARVDPIRTKHVSVTHRIVAPPVIEPAGELKSSTRHRHRIPRFGELSNERVRHFWEPPRRRFAWEKYAAARRRTSLSWPRSRVRFFASRTSALVAEVVPGLSPSSTSITSLHPVAQTGLRDTEVGAILSERLPWLTAAIDVYNVVAELSVGQELGTGHILSAMRHVTAPQIRCHQSGQKSNAVRYKSS